MRETIVNVVMPSSSATVFHGATKFNRDLSSWNVSRVTNMVYSKLCALFCESNREWNGRRVMMRCSVTLLTVA